MAIYKHSALLAAVAMAAITTGCKHGDSHRLHDNCRPVGVLNLHGTPCPNSGCYNSVNVDCGSKIITPGTGVPAPKSMPGHPPANLPPSTSKAPQAALPPIPMIDDIKLPSDVVKPNSSAVAAPAPASVPGDGVVEYDHGRLPRFEGNKLARAAEDFRWVIGEIYYSHTRKTWRLRYSPLDSADEFGGSLTIVGADHLLDNVKNGQLVRVEGDLVDRAVGRIAPEYRVVKISMVQE